MIHLEISQVKNNIALFQDEIDDYFKLKKEELHKLAAVVANSKQKAYASLLANKLNVLITADPDILNSFPKLFDKHITSDQLKSIEHIDFRDKVLNILGYNDLRANFYPRYFEKLGIKSCVYCNALPALSVERESGIIGSKFQLDHYLPKKEFPYFSISLFNLYPVCGNCNNIKGVKKVKFELYKNTPVNKSDFNFYLDDVSKANYFKSRDYRDLIVRFKQKTKISEHQYEDYQKLFEIEAIYNNQKDVAEELIQKSEIYSEEYKKNLLQQFPEILINEEHLDRLITGNYTSERDMHKRAMSKFIMDISVDIGLIKRE